MDDRSLKFLSILILMLIVALYFFIIQIEFNEVQIIKLDGSYHLRENALTRVQATIVYVMHIILLFIGTLRTVRISKKRSWSTLPLGQWISKLCWANLVVFILSLIILAIVRHILIGSFWSTIEMLKGQLETFGIWELLKMSRYFIKIPDMILTFILLTIFMFSYIFYIKWQSQRQLKEAELKEAQSQVEKAELKGAQSVEKAELKVEQLQTQLKEKANIISISLTQKSSEVIDLNGISLFTSKGRYVYGYDTIYEEVFKTKNDSLKQIERKIKASGWREKEKFQRVADNLIINGSSIEIWKSKAW